MFIRNILLGHWCIIWFKRGHSSKYTTRCLSQRIQENALARVACSKCWCVVSAVAVGHIADAIHSVNSKDLCNVFNKVLDTSQTPKRSIFELQTEPCVCCYSCNYFTQMLSQCSWLKSGALLLILFVHVTFTTNDEIVWYLLFYCQFLIVWRAVYKFQYQWTYKNIEKVKSKIRLFCCCLISVLALIRVMMWCVWTW